MMELQQNKCCWLRSFNEVELITASFSGKFFIEI